MKSLKTLFTKTAKVLLPVLMFVSAISANTSVVMAEEGEYAGKTIILHTNDVHGAIDKYKYVAGVKKDFASKGAEVILVDAGDYSQGQVYVSESKGATAVELMEDVGYDYVTLGNHEFDYGQDAAFGNLVDSEFKVLCANVEKAGGDLAFDGHDIKEIGGMKIGFFGLETPEAQTKVNPALIKGLKIYAEEKMYDAAKAEVKALKDAGADLVIGLVHLGDDASSEPNTSYDLAAKVSGIDMIIDGHAHSELTEGPNGETIVSTGSSLKNIGVIVIDNATKKIEENYLMPVGEDTPADADVAAAAQKIIDDIEAKLGQKFATSEVTLNGAKAPNGNRDSETNNGDLITDAMMYTILKDTSGLSVDPANVVAITNGGGIRAAVNPGDVSMKDIKTVLPFGNTVAVVYVSGAELLEALEASTYCTPESVGAFPQIAGMKITLDTTKEYDANEELYPGSTYYGPKTINRVTIDEINGKAFDPAAKYAVITNNFCAAGGDTYYAFASAKEQFDTGIPLDEAVVDYIKNELNCVISKEDYAEPQGRMKIIITVDATAKLYGTVTDAGQVVSKMDLTFNGEISDVDENTFTVNAKASAEGMVKILEEAGIDTANGAYNITRNIIKAETNGNTVTLTFRQDEGATLCYFMAGRNYPADLEYTVTSEGFKMNGADVTLGNVTVDTTVIDEETAKFTSVTGKDINYQFHEGDNDTLIVWFHGNGEGDLMSSGNNVAQMLANRGTVAWATPEAQEVFGNAHVMSFQAPDTWYYAEQDKLLEKAYAEIDEVVKKYGITKLAVSGCSAGGYMTTRMIIKYPSLFDVAMINCPALDLAQQRGGRTPTDAELKSIKNSRTAIWLVQGVKDASVNTEECSKRLFGFLTEGKTVTSKKITREYASDLETFETEDGKYKLSLYDVAGDEGKVIECAEDYNLDGKIETVQYSNHWTWIYTLRNDPEAANGEHIWQWASSKLGKPVAVKLYGTVTDAGQVVSKVELDFGTATVDAGSIKNDTFTVIFDGKNPSYYEESAGTSYGLDGCPKERPVIKTEVNGSKVTLYFDLSSGGTLTYLATAARNIPIDLAYSVKQNKDIVVNGANFNTNNYVVDNSKVIDPETAKFKSVNDKINYQYHAGSNDTLIVWFHGNGEGDYNHSGNNVAQMLANRGTVAWATPEAQAVFGNAHVMAFQAPDTWYYAQKDRLLEQCKAEIDKVVKDKFIKTVYVSGCSAGGYMTTRMLIKYPNFFKAAMINCPALDVATAKGGETPTDNELKSLQKSSTAIWLVQGAQDGTVNTEECSKRLFGFLTQGKTVTSKKFTRENASDFTTYETADNKYKLTLYDVAGPEGKSIACAEDYNLDGKIETVLYSNHWSWIYTLRNDPEAANGEHIWQWAKNYHEHKNLVKVPAVKPTCTTSGRIEYYQCIICKKKYADKNAEKEVTEVTLPALGHNFAVATEKCTRCGKYPTYVDTSIASAKLTSIKKAKGKFTAKWKKVSGIQGYVVRYSKSATMEGYKAYAVSKKKTSKTFKVAKKTRYYVQIRVYKTVGTKTVYSPWSSIKTVVTK